MHLKSPFSFFFFLPFGKPSGVLNLSGDIFTEYTFYKYTSVKNILELVVGNFKVKFIQVG